MLKEKKKKEKRDKDEIKSLKTIAGGALIVFIGMIIGKFLGYIYTIIVARLGTEPYGMLHLGYSFVSLLVTFSLLGFHNGILRFVPYYLARNDKAKVKGAITTSLKICIPLSIFLATAMFFFSDKIAIILFHNEKLIPIFKIFSIMIPFTTIGTLFLYSFTAFQKIKYTILNREIIERVVRLGFTIFLLAIGFGIFGASVSYIISAFIVMIVSFFIFEKKVFSIFKTRVKAKHYPKEMLKYSIPLVSSAFLLFIIGWTDTLMLGFFKTVSDVGIYNAAHPTAALMFIVPAALTALFLPIITQFYSKKKFGEIKKVYGVVSRWIFYINLPILLIMIFFSQQIIQIIFGLDYLIGATTLSILVFGYMFFSLAHTSTGILNMAKKSNLVFITTSIFAVINIILNYFLIPPYGINGAAIATSFSFIIGSIIYFIFSYKVIKCWPLKKSYFKAIIASLIAILLISFLAKSFFPVISIYGFIIIFLLFLGVYILLLFLFKSFESEDKEMFHVLKKRLKTKANPKKI